MKVIRKWVQDPVLKQLKQMEKKIMAGQQDQVNQITAAINQGVQELTDEIQRVQNQNPGVDLSGLQEIADRLANDNVPAAPTDPDNQPHPDQTLPGDL